jgi:hypothetical protein
MTIVDLDLARIKREDDNKKITVEDLMRLILDDLKTGDIDGKPVAAFVCVISDLDNGCQELTGYRSGLMRHEEIGYIETYKTQQIKKWMDG